ncbi:MAG: alpha/beta fold hydrolase [Herpetosiphonaceae bacterium]|nr:alpha/beta fold hydrolase [Herpetosiphonaceae bacterium]
MQTDIRQVGGKQLEHTVLYPAERRYATPLLLLHGAWHGAWCWQSAMQDFARRGFEVHAISLRGHGHSDRVRGLNFCSLADYVGDLQMAIAALERPPIVVGHSMGGYILQSLLMQQQLPGAVLLATIPLSGTLRFLSRWMLRHPLAVARALLTGNLRHAVGTPRLAREAFFRPKIPAAELQRYTALLGPESLRMALWDGMVVKVDPALNRSPLLVIAAERDAVFSVEEQRRTAAAYHAELVVIPEAAHDLMLDPAWPQAAAAIERFAKAL